VAQQNASAMADDPTFDLRTQREWLRHGDSAQLRMQQARKSLGKDKRTLRQWRAVVAHQDAPDDRRFHRYGSSKGGQRLTS